MKNLLTALAFLVVTQVFSQTCGTDQFHLYKMQTDSIYRLGYLKKEAWERGFYSNEKTSKSKMHLNDCGNVLTVPVVVHIIHIGEAVGQGSNITDTRVNNGIAYTNQLLANNFLGNAKIKLQLAKIDPDGNPTTGILRVDGSSVTDYSTLGIQVNGSAGANEQDVKDLSRWPTDKYYNIWVVYKIYNNATAGYANMPAFVFPYDGMVIISSHMNSNKTTLVHEFGHSLNLYHTFEGALDQNNCPINNNCLYDGDRVCDTPPHSMYACDIVNPCDTSDSYNCRYNLMSYCGNVFIFTPNQISRMRDALINIRPLLYNNNNLVSSTDTNEISISRLAGDTIQVFPSAGYNTIHFNANNWGSNTITGLNVKVYINSALIRDKNIALNLLPGTSQDIGLDSILYNVGDNQVQITLSNPNNQLNEAYTYNNTVCYSVEYITEQTEGEQCVDFTGSSSLSSFYTDNSIYVRNLIEYTDFLDFKHSTCTALGDSVAQFPSFLGYFGYGGMLSDPWKAYNLYSPTIDLTNTENAYFKFDLFHQKPDYNKTQMEVEVLASTDYGLNWQTIYKKNDFTVNTTIDGVLYTPTPNVLYTTLTGFNINDCNAWRTDSVNLSAYIGQKINLKYSYRKFISIDTTYGKYLYLDNFCVKICEEGECITTYQPLAYKGDITVFPNPTNSVITINYNRPVTNNITAGLYDIAGRCLLKKKLAGNPTEILDLGSYSPGVYMLSLDSEAEGLRTFKIVKTE